MLDPEEIKFEIKKKFGNTSVKNRYTLFDEETKLGKNFVKIIENKVKTKFPSKIKRDYMEFMDYQTKRYEECFEIVNLSTQGITIQAPDERPWQFIGVIPQIHNDEHDTLRAYNQVIKPEDFKKLLP